MPRPKGSINKKQKDGAEKVVKTVLEDTCTDEIVKTAELPDEPEKESKKAENREVVGPQLYTVIHKINKGRRWVFVQGGVIFEELDVAERFAKAHKGLIKKLV